MATSKLFLPPSSRSTSRSRPRPVPRSLPTPLPNHGGTYTEMVAYGGYSNTAKTARHIQTRTVTRSAPATAGSGVSSLAFVAVDARKQQVLLHRQRHHGDKPVDPEVLAVIKEMFLPMTSYRDSKKHNFGADSMQQQQHWCGAQNPSKP